MKTSCIKLRTFKGTKHPSQIHYQLKNKKPIQRFQCNPPHQLLVLNPSHFSVPGLRPHDDVAAANLSRAPVVPDQGGRVNLGFEPTQTFTDWTFKKTKSVFFTKVKKSTAWKYTTRNQQPATNYFPDWLTATAKPYDSGEYEPNQRSTSFTQATREKDDGNVDQKVSFISEWLC